MREIKFRGKDIFKDIGKWVYGYLIETKDGFEIVEGNGIEHVDGWEYSGQSFIVDEDTIGQYVGLKDIQSKELYEGDIVQAFDTEFKDSFKGVIKFGDGSFYIDGLDGTTHYRWKDYEVECIGNIHDNPELVEAEG